MSSGVVSLTAISPPSSASVARTKQGSFPPDALCSRTPQRYYEPLRLPHRPKPTSLPYTVRLCPPSGHSAAGLQHYDPDLPPHAVSATPEVPPTFVRLVSMAGSGLPLVTTGSAPSSLVSRLHLSSLALRPAALPLGNLRPWIAPAPLPGTTESHGHLPRRDFNPQDHGLLLHTVTSPFSTFRAGTYSPCGLSPHPSQATPRSV